MSTVASKSRGIWSKKTGGSYWSTGWLSRNADGGWVLETQEWRTTTKVELTHEDAIRLRDALNRELPPQSNTPIE